MGQNFINFFFMSRSTQYLLDSKNEQPNLMIFCFNKTYHF